MTVLLWGSALATCAGEIESGDRAVVAEFPGGALAAVIDGLGHGPKAARAASAAASVLEAAPQLAVDELVARCHEELRTTRGAVISLASFDVAHATLTWLGIGNVEGCLVRGGHVESIVLRGGTVGFRLPPLAARTLAVHAGDTLVLATDGVRRGFKDEIVASRDPQTVADHILAGFWKGTDDACVLVARYAPVATRIAIDGEAGVADARIQARDVAKQLGFAASAIEALATAVSELARNIVVHADHGEIVIVPAREGRRMGVAVIARDHGPGIRDVSLAMQDGFTTARGLGCGLSGARRLVDELRLESEVGAGTTVKLVKWLS